MQQNSGNAEQSSRKPDTHFDGTVGAGLRRCVFKDWGDICKREGVLLRLC